ELAVRGRVELDRQALSFGIDVLHAAPPVDVILHEKNAGRPFRRGLCGIRPSACCRLAPEEELPMRMRPLFLAGVLAFLAGTALAQQKEIKIGFIYDVTGPFAGGGSEPAQLGTKAIVDYFNERGGVAGYKIVPIFAD